MSDQVEKPAPAPKSGSSAAMIRQGILLFILVLGIIGLIWEFAFARPNWEKAWTTVQEIQDNSNRASADRVATDKTVQEALGFEPSEVRDDFDGHKLEIYRWRRGLPVLSHPICVGYRQWTDPNDEKNIRWVMVFCAQKDNPDDSEWVSTTEYSRLAADEFPADEQPMAPGGGGPPSVGGPAGGGNPAGGGGRGGRGGRGARGGDDNNGGGGDGVAEEIDALFESDADDDGKVSKEEATGTMADNFDKFDQNLDGFVTRDEAMAYIYQGRADLGAGGGNQRPDSDDGDTDDGDTDDGGTGDDNTGDDNTGDDNTGDDNTGDDQ